MTFLLDTNACIHFLNGTSPALIERVLRAGPGRVAISSLTLAELHFGAARSGRREANRARIDAFAGELVSLVFDDDSAVRFGAVKAEMLSRGLTVPDFDLAIAATALTRGLTVVTADRHFTDIPGLPVEDWAPDPG